MDDEFADMVLVERESSENFDCYQLKSYRLQSIEWLSTDKMMASVKQLTP